MVEKYGFVYIWYDRKHKRYYIGCHWGTVDDGYICSSDRMRAAHRRRPHDFKRRILKNKILTRKEMYKEEQRYFDMIKLEEVKVRYYNLRLNNFRFGEKSEEELNGFRDKQSKKQKGKPRSEETKEKIRQTLLGKKHLEERAAKLRGQKRSDECKEKMKVARANQIITDENLKRRANTMTEYWKSEKAALRKEKMRQDFIHNNPKKVKIVLP